tara:strand:- start:5424 stop:5741 length:318 start_codon:yes stop_codon:yes gene_type:complete
MFIKQNDFAGDYNSTSEARSRYKRALRERNVRASTVSSAVGYLMLAVEQLKEEGDKGKSADLEIKELRSKVTELEDLVKKMASTKVMSNLLKSKRSKAAPSEDSP